MNVVLYRDVPTKTGVREILVDEKDAESLLARGWKMKGGTAVKAEPPKPVEAPVEKKGKKKRR